MSIQYWKCNFSDNDLKLELCTPHELREGATSVSRFVARKIEEVQSLLTSTWMQFMYLLKKISIVKKNISVHFIKNI